jgi:hypothetical protein
LLKTKREIKSDIFVTPFTEFVRFFKILFGKSIKIRTEYKLWFLGRSILLETTFLNISDDIEITFPCSTRHLELVIKTYLDFDRAYLLCPEETLCVSSKPLSKTSN